ncbi:MAG: conjugal transfer protein TraN [Nitrospiraceae bacterium]|nr:conjugal transfer protein TraN [Nitrospiraceae bacterium]
MKHLVKISRSLFFVLAIETLSPVIPQIGAAQAFADTYVCGQDLNNDGNVSDPGETANCIATQQGRLCPISSAACAAVQACPLGNYPCSGGACTQAGTCSSIHVQVTQYQCPTTGQIYNDSSTCTSNCLQEAFCSGATFSGGGTIGYLLDYSIGKLSFSGSGNTLTITGSGTNNSWTSSASVTVSGATFSGGGTFNVGEIEELSFQTWGSELSITAIGYGSSQAQTINIMVNGAALSGSGTLGYPGSWGIQKLSLSGSGNTLAITGTGYANSSSLWTSSVSITASSATCPLAGGSACSGNPPTCTAGRACIITSGTETQYQCSLTGVNYSTQSGCTSACSKTATCGTNYTCPLGSQYACMDNNGTMECSPNQCVDLTTNPATVTNTNSNMLQNNGQTDSSGNCLGQIYIFTGRSERCHGAGVSDGFHDCCANKSNMVLSDSVGAASALGTAASAVSDIYHMAQVAYYTNAILTTGGASITSSLSSASLAVQQAVTDGVAAGSVDAGLESYAAALLNPTTIAISAAILLVNYFLLQSCDQQDMEVAMLNASGYCHYVGEYCEESWPLIGCVQEARGYCCFNSKLARIIQEQGRPQLTDFQPGGAWGSGQSPNCRGFTPEEFQMLDFSKIDLSSYYGDLEKNLTGNLQKATNNEEQNINNFYQNTQK